MDNKTLQILLIIETLNEKELENVKVWLDHVIECKKSSGKNYE